MFESFRSLKPTPFNLNANESLYAVVFSLQHKKRCRVLCAPTASFYHAAGNIQSPNLRRSPREWIKLDGIIQSESPIIHKLC